MTTTEQKCWRVLGWASLLFLFFAVAKVHACPTGKNCPRGAVCNVSTECVDPGSPEELATTKDQLGLTLEPEDIPYGLSIHGSDTQSINVSGEAEAGMIYQSEPLQDFHGSSSSEIQSQDVMSTWIPIL